MGARNLRGPARQFTQEIVALLEEYGDALGSVRTKLLGVLGEGIVCGELRRRGIEAELCPGNRRAVDLILTATRRRVQVKTSTSRDKKFVTGLAQKGFDNGPDYWVLVLVAGEGTRFFVLTHQEICALQKARNAEYARRFFARRGRQPDLSRGVDNLSLADVAAHEDAWAKLGVPRHRAWDGKKH